MRTQNDWINIFKSAMRIKTDYRLAKRWQVEPTRIHQYRKGRLKLPLAAILDMAESINIDPVEIMASLAIAGARECDKKRLTDAYWSAAIKTVGNRLDEAGHGQGYYRRR